MALPIDISSLDAFAKLMGDVVKSGNKEMLNELAAGFRQGILEEGRKLIKEAGLPQEEDDWDMDDLEEAVAKGTDKSSARREAADRTGSNRQQGGFRGTGPTA